MGNSSTPIRIDEALHEAAKHVGRLQSRSAAQQITHWARLGREMEASRAITAHAITAVLEGRTPYDDIDTEGQAVVRATWTDRLDAVAAGIDLASEFEAARRAHWVDIAPDGTLIRRVLDPNS